jgi:hypothetical protein
MVLSKKLPKNLRPRDILILGATLLSSMGGLGLLYRSCAYQQVWLVNALEVPVTVELSGDRSTIEPGSRVAVTLHEGVRDVRVLSADGRVLEEGPIDIPSRQDAVAYNVLGAAPLYFATIRYSQNPDQNSSGPDAVEVFAGSRLIARDRVDYVFAEPPRSIQIKQGARAVRYRFDMEEKGGWKLSVSYLESTGKVAEAAELCRAAVLAAPADRADVDHAANLLEAAHGPHAALRLLRELRTVRPDDPSIHFEYQYRMRRLGRGAELLAEYRELEASHPGSPLYGVLLARAGDFEQLRTQSADLLLRYPGDTEVISNAAHLAFSMGDYARSVDLCLKIENSPEYERIMDRHIRSLVGTGRTRDALSLAARLAGADNANPRPAMLYAALARKPDASPPEPPMTFLKRIAEKGNPHLLVWASAVLGEPQSADLTDLADAARQAADIHMAAGKDPAEAWEKCASASPAAFRALYPAAAVLLGAEFARAGDRELAHRILQNDLGLWFPESALIEYVFSGTRHPDFWRLDPEIRAALAFVRARHLQSRGEPTQELDLEAERGDLLELFVTRARRSWPPVKKDDSQAKQVLKRQERAGPRL